MQTKLQSPCSKLKHRNCTTSQQWWQCNTESNVGWKSADVGSWRFSEHSSSLNYMTTTPTVVTRTNTISMLLMWVPTSETEQEPGESWWFWQRAIGCIRTTQQAAEGYTATRALLGQTQTRKWPAKGKRHQTDQTRWWRTRAARRTVCSSEQAGNWCCDSSCAPGCPGCRSREPSLSTGTSTPRTLRPRSTTLEWSRRSGTDAAGYLTCSGAQQHTTHTHKLPLIWT